MMDVDGPMRAPRLLGGGGRRRDDRDDEGLDPAPPVARAPGKGGQLDADEALGFRGPVDRRAAVLRKRFERAKTLLRTLATERGIIGAE